MTSEGPGLAARRLALGVLEAVLLAHRPLDRALADAFAGTALDARDRALARELAMTVLRRRREIDVLIGRCLERPLPRAAAVVSLVLALGAAQLLYLQTPAHAAIATAVALAGSDRRPRVRGFKGLVNAVLRRLARDGAAWRSGLDSARLALPDWLWQRWTTAYGEAAARNIARLALAPPPLDLTPRDAAARAWLVDALPNAALLPQGSVRLAAAGRIEDLPGYRDGRWWVQDAAAAMPALLLRVRSGQRAIDLCAAPGGKTLQLAAAGAAVTAVDLSPARLARLADNLKRTGLDAALVCADAADWRPDAPAEAVLLDAPCTATGTLRRRPDIAHRKNADDIAAMAAVQRRLLDHAASMLAPGGVLVYAVCSLEREEGEDRVADFLAMHPHFRRQPVVAAEMPGLEQALTAAGDVRILPSHWQARGGIDGFFIARLRTAA